MWSLLFISALQLSALAAPTSHQSCSSNAIRHGFDTPNPFDFLQFPGWIQSVPSYLPQPIIPSSSPIVAYNDVTNSTSGNWPPATGLILAPTGSRFQLQSLYVGGDNATYFQAYAFAEPTDAIPVLAKEQEVQNVGEGVMQKIDFAEFQEIQIKKVQLKMWKAGDEAKTPVSFAIDDVVAIQLC